ncbi:type I-G CRISPR-associated protein Csb2 [Bremerella alba]|uniref:Type I-U CRISPR-associated protein Cas5/Cas6 n=1 Tax=Bremerella alba TaxID=980252 RepID=A0A7V8V2M0_9BACT|nr:type I-U CRISPR-associated protein Csb2 [Bremerella alba]MBA2113808.1 hypothetical protein [Bremerella alba]
MKQSSPYGCDEQWGERYVAGHAGKSKSQHRQFSYIPMPSIGHKHGDRFIRRALITAPAGDEQWLRHLAERLQGELLKPEKACEFEEGQIPRLLKIPGDSVTRCFTRASNVWHSVTPAILPGHDDHITSKTQRLIEKALADFGIVQPYQYKWNTVSRFPKSFSAHKTDRNKRPAGYLRLDHLLSQTAVHLTLRFQDSEPFGPLIIGGGRYYGFGLMANVFSDT